MPTLAYLCVCENPVPRTARLLTVSHSTPCISGGSAQPPRMQTPLEADPPEEDPPVNSEQNDTR